MLTVAIASENDAYDAEIYRVLLERMLGRTVARWATDMRFNGYRSVWKLAEPFLVRAQAAGIRHALLAVDNDGGAKRQPEHDASHDTLAQADDKDGCRFCWLTTAIPSGWAGHGTTCIVVPVQAIETWLLHLRGVPLAPTPESYYDRGALKRRFFGTGALPPVEKRQQLALAELNRPDAIERLMERPSFRLFATQLEPWR
jgi:hypothetical protein